MARKRPARLFVLYAAALSVLLLAPFDIRAANGARWAHGDRGMAFPSPGVAHSTAPAQRLYRDLTSGTGLALEVWLATDHPDQTGPARIVSYSLDTAGRNFTLGQVGGDLDMRLRTTETTLNGTPSLHVPDVFAAGVRRHLVVTYDFRLLCAYVDGRRAACRSAPAGGFGNWDPGHYILLGNERTADRPWLGTLFLVAVYDRALTAAEIETAYGAASGAVALRPATGDGLVALYALGERSGDILRDSSGHAPVDLAIPRNLEQPRCAFLSPPNTTSRVSAFAVVDVVGNVVIFVPLGFLGYRLLRGRGWPAASSIVASAAIAAAFTLGAESAQYALASRCSQRVDILLNLAGGCAGALAAYTRSRRAGFGLANGQ